MRALPLCLLVCVPIAVAGCSTGRLGEEERSGEIGSGQHSDETPGSRGSRNGGAGTADGEGDRGADSRDGTPGGDGGDGDGDQGDRSGDNDRDDGRDDGLTEDGPPAEVEFAPATMRRLTQEQYRNSLTDIFGSSLSLDFPLEPDEQTEAFQSIGASKVATSDRGVEQYFEAAVLVAQQVVSGADPAGLLKDCAPDSANDPCVRTFLSHYGRLLFRRPLTDEELERFGGIVGAGGGGADTLRLGITYALAAMLQSPDFLYLIIEGEPEPEGGLRSTDYEMASRLSYLIWNTTPDDKLLSLAEEGRLTTDEDLLEAVDDMLDDPRGERLVTRFFAENWGILGTDARDKNPELFPTWSEELWNAYMSEFDLTLRDIAVTRDSDLREVFTGRETFIDDLLAQTYGMQATGGNGFEATALPNERHGLLTSGALLAATSPSARTSPTRRGLFVMEYLLCEEIPPPPEGVATDLVSQPDPDDFRTNRERLEEHRVNPACAGCHAVFDPAGLVFENYDAIGRFRTEVNDVEIDPSGEFGGIQLDDVGDLADYLHSDPRASHCMAERFMAFATGHHPGRGGAPAIDALNDEFADRSYRFAALVRATVLSAYFRRFTVEGD